MEVLNYMDILKDEERFIYSYDNDEYYDLLEQRRLNGFLEYALKKEETDKIVAEATKKVSYADKKVAAINRREEKINEKVTF